MVSLLISASKLGATSEMVSHNLDSSTDDVFKGKAILRCKMKGLKFVCLGQLNFPTVHLLPLHIKETVMLGRRNKPE